MLGSGRHPRPGNRGREALYWAVLYGWCVIMAEESHLCKRSTSTNTLWEAFPALLAAPWREALANKSHLRWSQARQDG
jgi:hypothetical protein